MDIQTICILGAGTLGSRVALQAAISGFTVSVYDKNRRALDSSLSTMEKIQRQLIKSNQLSEEISGDVLNRIKFTLDPKEEAKDADLINESVVEDVDVKRTVWEEFGKIAPEKTIFTTNTSYLLPSMFAEISGRPAQFCAFHFHDVFFARVVDIMPHPGTNPSLVPILEDLGRKLNQVPIVIEKENPGYIFNTLLMSFIGAAGKLLTGEVGSIEAIDKSWMVNFHMPMGPFGILDSIGLDTAWHVTSARKDSASRAFANLLKKYINEGKLGEKSGAGFYTYPHPKFKDPDFLT